MTALPRVDIDAAYSAEPPAPADGKSDGQALLDRALEQCNRYNRLRQRLDVVRALIAPTQARQAAAEPGPPPPPATTFFDGLAMIADGNDQVADELEQSIAALERLF